MTERRLTRGMSWLMLTLAVALTASHGFLFAGSEALVIGAAYGLGRTA